MTSAAPEPSTSPVEAHRAVISSMPAPAGFSDLLRDPGRPGGALGASVPAVKGVPALLREPEGRLAGWLEVNREPVFDDLSYGELAFLARYAPSLSAPLAGPRGALRRWLAHHVEAPVAVAVEAGCAIGAELRLLRAYAQRVIGFDLSPAALRFAADQLSGSPRPALRRLEGRSFEHRRDWLLPPVDGALVLLGDVMDPPIRPGVAQLVVAMNLLDNVEDPIEAIERLDALVAPGGLLVLGSPFAWRDDLTRPDRQLGGGTIEAFVSLGSARSLHALLTGQTPLAPSLSYTLLETGDFPWQLEDHTRCRITFDVHLVLARKAA